MATTFENKTVILSDLWLNYRSDEEFTDFVEYNDLGLPLAYAHINNIVKLNDVGIKMVEETFDLFLAGLEVEDAEEGFESLDELLGLDF